MLTLGSLQSVRAAAQEGAMHFLTVNTLEGGSYRFPLLSPRVSIGRSSQNDLVLGDPAVSRLHAAIRCARREVRLEDASRHGTWVNGQPVRDAVPLRPGDCIRLGGTELVFDADSPGARAETGPWTGDGLSLPLGDVLTPQAIRTGGSSQETRRILQLVVRADSALTGRQPFHEMCGSLLDLAAEVAPYERGAVFTVHDGAFRAVAERNPEGGGSPLQPSRSLIQPALESGEAVLMRQGCLADGRDLSQSVAAAGIRSAMCVPLCAGGETLGLLYVDRRQDGTRGFDRESLEILGHLAVIGGARLRQSLLEETARDRARLELDLRRAGELQARFQPATAPSVPGYLVHGVSEPCLGVGGDSFDYLSLPDGRLGLMLSDVAGKGLPAALLMCCFHTAFEMIGSLGLPPSETVARVNRGLMRRVPSNRFITVFYGVLDPVDHRLDYVNAGQNIPLLVHDDGAIERLDVSGMPLGMYRDAAYAQGSLELRSGDLFVCYSDGATEATNGDGIQFGVDRLEKVSRTVRGRDPGDVITSVWRALDRFHQSRPPEDDITILALSRR